MLKGDSDHAGQGLRPHVQTTGGQGLTDTNHLPCTVSWGQEQENRSSEVSCRQTGQWCGKLACSEALWRCLRTRGAERHPVSHICERPLLKAI